MLRRTAIVTVALVIGFGKRKQNYGGDSHEAIRTSRCVVIGCGGLLATATAAGAIASGYGRS